MPASQDSAQVHAGNDPGATRSVLGIAVLLALLLIPLGGPQALLPVLLDTVVGPLADLVTGGP